MESQQLNVTPVAPKRRSVEEELNDYQAQRQMAYENLLSLRRMGVTTEIAEAVVNAMGNAGAGNFNDLILLNNQWSSISEILQKQRNLTRDQIIRVIRKYRDTFGLEGIARAPNLTEIEQTLAAQLAAQPVPPTLAAIQKVVQAHRPRIPPELMALSVDAIVTELLRRGVRVPGAEEKAAPEGAAQEGAASEEPDLGAEPKVEPPPRGGKKAGEEKARARVGPRPTEMPKAGSVFETEPEDMEQKEGAMQNLGPIPPAGVEFIWNDDDAVVRARARRLYAYVHKLNRGKIIGIAEDNIPEDNFDEVFGRTFRTQVVGKSERGGAAKFVNMFIRGMLVGKQTPPREGDVLPMYYLVGEMAGFGLPQPKFHRKGHATIMLPREGNRRIVGRGIAPSPKPRYAEFGKLVIHVPSLNKGILNIKYRSRSNVQGLPQQNISSDMVDFLLDVIEKGQVNQSLFNKLSKEDQRLFVKIGGSAQIDDGLGYRSIHDEEEKKEMDRFNLVRGIFLAGNNSKEVIQELQGFLRKFLHDGRISKSEGLSLLQEISVLV
jgi:hypothetical protein